MKHLKIPALLLFGMAILGFAVTACSNDNDDDTGTMDDMVAMDDDTTDECTTQATDTYSINLNAADCTVDVQTTLGIISQFIENVSGDVRSITANAIANHDVGVFPNGGNPNTISTQSLGYEIDAAPTAANTVTYLTENGRPNYIVGILFSGVEIDPIAAEYFTNTNTGQDNTDWNENALSSHINLGTDCNNAHVQPSGAYHYHATPSAYIASLGVDGTQQVQIGYAADGFAIYYKYGYKNGAVSELTSSYQLKTGSRGGDGVSAPDGCYDGTYTQDYEYVDGLGDLDECNGYTDPETGEYYYVVTDTYPSLPRCFTGTPSDDFTIGRP